MDTSYKGTIQVETNKFIFFRSASAFHIPPQHLYTGSSASSISYEYPMNSIGFPFSSLAKLSIFSPTFLNPTADNKRTEGILFLAVPVTSLYIFNSSFAYLMISFTASVPYSLHQPRQLQPTRQHPPYAQLLFKSGRCCHAEFVFWLFISIVFGIICISRSRFFNA